MNPAELLPQVYTELRMLAASKIASGRKDMRLNANTFALVTGCGTPRVGRKLAQPEIFRQGQDRRSVAVRVRVG